MRYGKIHREITQGRLKIMAKGGDRLWLLSLPGVTKHLRPRTPLHFDIGSLNLARIGEDGPHAERALGIRRGGDSEHNAVGTVGIELDHRRGR